MRIIVGHTSPDLDVITSVWLIKKFLPGWEKAGVQFVPAGEAVGRTSQAGLRLTDPIEKMGRNLVIQVDTGLGPLDHHQTQSDKACAATLTFDYVMKELEGSGQPLSKEKFEALQRIVNVILEEDHFKEIFRSDPLADYHEFLLGGILDGLRLEKPDQDEFQVDFIAQALDALLHQFENRIWAEKEIKENGTEFNTRFGKGIAFEVINDSVIKLAQKMGYYIVVRKDPRKGYVRIKGRPNEVQSSKLKVRSSKDIDLTLAYEKLSKMDPNATWFLHVSKKMLLNGTVKNPKMNPTKLSLNDIIEVLKTI
ncbi:MAG: hypothetical protein M1444_04240 [Patescibacteria group bacterium]|nr:hypothetical protein [Patescibacteria group bacterium]